VVVLVVRVLMAWIPLGFLSGWYYESERYSNCFVLMVRVDVGAMMVVSCLYSL
jgi:hypothetical protein